MAARDTEPLRQEKDLFFEKKKKTLAPALSSPDVYSLQLARRPDTLRDRFAFLCLALLLPWSALLQTPHPINHDTAWFFYVARGVMNGGVLYRDYIEPNAPLASLSLVPAVWLGRVLGLGPGMAVEVIVLAYASVAMALSDAVLRHMRAEWAARLGALAALTIAFVFLPKGSFSQREHILAMLLTPYGLACAAARMGVRLPRSLGGAIGLAGAFAVGLKPPFIPVPVALEMVVMFGAGWRTALRSQTIGLAAGLTVIVGVTLIFFPLYVTSVIPWATALYGGYNEPDLVERNLAYALAAGVVMWVCWRVEDGQTSRAFRACLTAATLGAIGAFVVQGKGWPYQVFPTWFFLFLLNAGAIATTNILPAGTSIGWAQWSTARLWAVCFGLYIYWGPAVSENVGHFNGVTAAVAAEPGPFVILSSDTQPGWGMALEQGRVWASRAPSLIMLPGLVQAAQRGRPSPWERPFRDWINDDMRRYRPPLVFIPPNGPTAMPPDFDVLAWLLRDPGFAAIWSRYHQVGTPDGFRMFRLS
jgi:hypothetical protein